MQKDQGSNGVTCAIQKMKGLRLRNIEASVLKHFLATANALGLLTDGMG